MLLGEFKIIHVFTFFSNLAYSLLPYLPQNPLNRVDTGAASGSRAPPGLGDWTVESSDDKDNR